MATVTTSLPSDWTLADLHRALGDIPLERIRLHPPPGTATESDVIAIRDREERLCELVDGVLVEKTMGWYESQLAVLLAHFLHRYLEKHDLGTVLGADGALKILPAQVRIPDVCFIRWDRLPPEPAGKPIPDLAPDLAVEVLSESNTQREMDRKLQEYFSAGTRLVWYVDPPSQSVKVYTSPEQCTVLSAGDTLTGDPVLPGFALPLAELFAKAEPK
jgi:Uma2 family endonuclease